MLNIFLQVSIEKNWRFKKFVSSSNSYADIEFLNLSELKNQREVRKQKRVWLFCCFDFERNYDVSKSCFRDKPGALAHIKSAN